MGTKKPRTKVEKTLFKGVLSEMQENDKLSQKLAAAESSLHRANAENARLRAALEKVIDFRNQMRVQALEHKFLPAEYDIMVESASNALSSTSTAAGDLIAAVLEWAKDDGWIGGDAKYCGGKECTICPMGAAARKYHKENGL